MITIFPLRLSWRIARNPIIRRSGLVTLATSATLVMLFIGLQAFTLTGAQVADRDFGRFAYRVDLDGSRVAPAGDVRKLMAAVAAARAAGAADAIASIRSPDVRPATTTPPRTTYFESHWPSTPFPQRYQLLGGRWPTEPGEAVVTHQLSSLTASDGVLGVLSGNARLRIVGTVVDRYRTDDAEILAAPGTWGSLNGAELKRKLPSTSATAAIFWSEGDSDAVLSAIYETAGFAAGQPGVRAQVADVSRRGFVEQYPLGIQLPALAVPFLVVMAMYGLCTYKLRRTVRILEVVGTGDRTVVGSVALAVGGAALASSAAGMTLGFALGPAVRLVCGRLATAPLSPLPSLAYPLSHILSASFTACVVGSLWIALRRSVFGAPRLPEAEPETFRAVRLGLFGATFVAAVTQIARLDDISSAMIFIGVGAAALLLIVPEVVSSTVRILPGRGARSRLIRRQALNSKGRMALAASMLTISLGAPLTFAIVFSTMIATEQAQDRPQVPHGQMALVSANGADPPSPALAAAVGTRVHPDLPPIKVYYLADLTRKAGLVGRDVPTLLAVDSAAELGRLTGADLSATQTQTLKSGGLLVWSAGEPRIELLDMTTGRRIDLSPPLSKESIDLDPAWRTSVSGVVLTSTAQALHLPTILGKIVYTDVTPEQSTAARQAALDNGLDPALVNMFTEPAAISPPPAFYVAGVGLSILVLLIVMTLVRSQAGSLRRLSGALAAIGVPARWSRVVLTIEAALVVAIATVLGSVLALPVTALAIIKVPGFTIRVPWAWLAVIIGGFYVGAALAALLATRQIRPDDRWLA